MRKFLLTVAGICLLQTALLAFGSHEPSMTATEPDNYKGKIFDLEPAENGRFIITALIEKNGNSYQAVRKWTTRSRISVDVYGPVSSQLSIYEGQIIHLIGDYRPGENNPWYGELFNAEFYREN